MCSNATVKFSDKGRGGDGMGIVNAAMQANKQLYKRLVDS